MNLFFRYISVIQTISFGSRSIQPIKTTRGFQHKQTLHYNVLYQFLLPLDEYESQNQFNLMGTKFSGWELLYWIDYKYLDCNFGGILILS